jgi:High-affinity nickel-transport protein
MPFFDLLTSSSLGSLLGMRHALEPDHLAAVTTLVSRERSALRGAWLGLCWGLGHTASLVVVGALLVLLRAEMPAALTSLFEFGVAVMLVGLGARSIVLAARQGPDGPLSVHRHGGLVHRHQAGATHVHVGAWTLAQRPLLVGAVHGLAGSGALTALVLTTLPTNAARMAYLVLFGLGSTLGMAALSGLLGWPLARLGTHQAFGRGIALVVGCATTALGMTWGYPLVAQLF